MAGTLAARFLRSRAWRTYTRSWEARAAILAAGIAFFGVFALFPLLVLGFAAAGLVIGGNQRLQDTIIGFAIDPATGMLIEPREVARVPAPTCIVFTQT